MNTLRTMVVLTAAALSAGPVAAKETIKLGILNDRSSVYADAGGLGSEIAARMAVEDFLKTHSDWQVDVIGADHQNKPDLASSIARSWYDKESVDVILDVPNTAAALAVAQVTRDKNKLFIDVGAASSDLTGEKCSPTMMHWAFDTWTEANGIVSQLAKEGGNSWFFITADYTFGYALQRDAASILKGLGGTVTGEVRHPFPANDFSSYLVQAQTSKAKVIGLANSGADTINALKQATEFGIVDGGQRMAPLILSAPDVVSVGLEASQGVIAVEAFYWDRNDASREWSKKFAARFKNRMPDTIQTGLYSAVTHYLKSVEAAGTKETGPVIAKMKELPTDDILFGKGRVRPDGRHVQDMYVFRVKKPSESKSTWDMYTQIATIPAEQAFRPIEQGNCPTAR